MFLEDPKRTHLPGTPGQIVALYESTNQPLVQPSGRGAQAAQAAVAGFSTRTGFEVVIALSLSASGDNVIYSGETVPESELPQALEEALNFAESMGFLLDSAGWQQLDDAHRRELLVRLPAFRPPQAKKEIAPVERVPATDPLAAVARLFAAFALVVGLGVPSQACTGMSSEQRERAAEIHYDLGSNLLNAGDTQGALKEYLEAVEDNPDLPNVHNGLGVIYAYSFGRWDEAEAELKKAVALDANFSEGHTNLGALYIARGRFAEAVPHFEKALKNALYKDRVLAQGNLGWALYKSGSSDKGIGELKSALSLAPRYCLGWRQLGSIYAELNRLEEASVAFAKYEGACPDVADAHLQAGKVLARLSRAADARVAFERCTASKVEKDAPVATECARFLKELGAP